MRLSDATKAVLSYLLNKRLFQRHKPEDKILRFKIRWLSKEERKIFEKEYACLIQEEIILKEKKQTGKGTDWHIRLNPRKLKEALELIGHEENENEKS